MDEQKTGFTRLRSIGSSHLSIELMEVGVPTPQTIEKIKAEANEDLLKNNKYSQGKKEYLDTNTIRRMLNDAFSYQWSWEIIDYNIRDDGGSQYALVYGRLHLPGLGFRDAFGAAKIESGKKDNSAVFASASSYAFKNAVKQTGIAANLFDDNFDEDLWLDDFDKPEKKAEPAAPAKKKPITDDEDDDTPPVKKDKPAPKDDDAEEFTDAQKAAMAELREIHKIKTNKQLLGLFQIWNKDVKSLGDITPKKLDAFIAYYDKNEDEFEDFDPEEVS